MITKSKLQEHISKLPEEISLDELIERFIFIDKLEKRIELSKNNEVLSMDEVEKNIEKWFE